ncbi:MAG: glycoside hydrolase family 3 C-terminal domain-containing protein [Clostridia bacterium]|nr:glycoside hydrolase family 3 C-terminal domain-containing protein [Clostridia bacterium]
MKRFASCQMTSEITERERKNKQIALNSALEGIVLLKNNGALPIKDKKIALYGAGAQYTIKGGTGSGEVNERHAVSILEGLKNEGFIITTDKWLSDYQKEFEEGKANWNATKNGGIVNMMANPYLPPYGRLITEGDVIKSECDTAIYVVSRQAGEGADKKIERGEFDLSEKEIENIKFIAKSYKNSVLVINSGSYMNLSVLDEVDLSAVIFYCQQGMEGGTAFSQLLSGKENFSGKLTDSWAKEYKDLPCAMKYSYLSGNTKEQYYKEGIYVGYRYFDTFNVSPRFHFGFGLSYTSFEIAKQSVEVKDNKITVKASVKNVGDFAGKEVVQVYVSCPNGKLDKEYQRLVGFEKTEKLVNDGEQIVKISFDLDYLASYCEKCAANIVEKGEYVVRVGNSSNNTKPFAILTVKEDIVISKNQNVCQRKEQVEEIVNPKLVRAEDLSGIEILEIVKNDYQTKVIEYKTPEKYFDQKVDKILNTLSVKEMVEVCVGTGMLCMFTSNKLFTPGQVGRTTDKLYKKGIINLNLADGPAGLRLLKECALTKKGSMCLVEGNYQMSWMEFLPKFLLKPLMAGKKDTKMYQYTTAFPVGTALAQSWNQDLCVKIGQAIGEEMDEYNISYWLAPAMNIHRNPLCGRNFEYFSEDPVLTGKIAAALTRGVQTKEGNYATIKHFACNNAEDDRTFSNSNVNERALREIYLKGFEICVKESAPKSVMTSYNLINGTYTPNSYDLCTKVLRNEWGFDGVVMTDWFSTNKGQGRNDLAIKAGNDLIMPGGNFYKKEILKGLKKGTITVEDLKRATANVLRQILYSRVSTREENPITPEMFD